ncbi:ATP-binding protein [Kitasatospora sp. NBC_01539]|uniref:sensor histidine kinase n=1 Tax=Kitasatospora sp. NBC_01539 TaxID=2903577 RepID=UPI0038602B1A
MAQEQQAAAPALPTAAADRRGVARWTTRRWLRAGVGTALVVLCALGTVGAWALDHAAAVSDHLVDRSSPALIASVRLESALINQETGIRGYGATGRSEFLQPYTLGLRQQASAVAVLRSLAGTDRTDRDNADLDAVLACARVWQESVARPVAALPPGAPAPDDVPSADRGRQTFDDVRTALTAQQQHLQDERAAGRADLAAARRLRDTVFIAIGAVVLLMTALVFEGLRRGVTGPLTRLGADARRVSAGDFAHRITPTGPADLQALAADVDAMRRRLTEEVALKERARLDLDRQAADLRRSNAELEQFAYVASHDLQEPLRKVASFCQLLQRRYADALDARANQYIDFAVDGAGRMQTLINDLLTFSRVGRTMDARLPVDLDALADRTLDTLSIAIEESGARITRDPLPTLDGDPTQLGMLLQNLIGNAVKFRSPERPPRIHLGAARDADGTWTFAVEDNGIGIEPEFAERVFVIFQRLHTREAYEGNGIGLAMCKKIVEYHGGTIALDPRHAPGTRLTFTLPGS